jgi:hypothetical protein
VSREELCGPGVDRLGVGGRGSEGMCLMGRLKVVGWT